MCLAAKNVEIFCISPGLNNQLQPYVTVKMSLLVPDCAV